MTQEEELAIIRPWAAAMPEKYDYVYLFKTLGGVNYYSLYHKSYIGHKCGTPKLAIVQNGEPIRLNRIDCVNVVVS